jgi:hypothetical protein
MALRACTQGGLWEHVCCRELAGNRGNVHRAVIHIEFAAVCEAPHRTFARPKKADFRNSFFDVDTPVYDVR